jgi:SAM-dependent methyltransferase
MLRDHEDAFGHEILDHHEGKPALEIVERDDGYVSASSGPRLYFAPYEEWWKCESKAMSHVRGRVLDVGYGAGRHALYLQERGHDVLGIDLSPLAVQVSRERGVKDARVLPLSQVGSKLGTFDTILMLGNNFALFGTPGRARRMLRRFHRITLATGRVVAQTRDPYRTSDPDHLEYHERNRRRGRMPGQARIRILYRRYRTPWFDFLMVSQDEMKTLLEGTGWNIERIIDETDGIYVAILEKV